MKLQYYRPEVRTHMTPQVLSQPILLKRVRFDVGVVEFIPAGNIVGWSGSVPLALFNHIPYANELWAIIFDKDQKVVQAISIASRA